MGGQECTSAEVQLQIAKTIRASKLFSVFIFSGSSLLVSHAKHEGAAGEGQEEYMLQRAGEVLVSITSCSRRVGCGGGAGGAYAGEVGKVFGLLWQAAVLLRPRTATGTCRWCCRLQMRPNEGASPNRLVGLLDTASVQGTALGLDVPGLWGTVLNVYEVMGSGWSGVGAKRVEQGAFERGLMERDGAHGLAVHVVSEGTRYGAWRDGAGGYPGYPWWSVEWWIGAYGRTP